MRVLPGLKHVTVLLIVVCCFISIAEAQNRTDQFFIHECNSTTDTCNSTYINTKCDTVSDGTIQCACYLGFEKVDGQNTCLKYVGVEDICEDGRSSCERAPNTRCLDDGTNQNIKRCRCATYYTSFTDDDGNTTCKFIINSGDDAACKDCEDNDGICYSDNSTDFVRRGCKCPVSQIGENCTTRLVNVSCVLSAFEMQVCYEPHPEFNFTEGATLYADKYGGESLCQGKLARPGDSCAEQNVFLPLSLAEDDLERCGITDKYQGSGLRRFSVQLISQKDTSVDSEKIAFRVYCDFSTERQISYGGVSVETSPGNDQGEHKIADIDFDVYNELNQELTQGSTVRLNDQISFGLRIREDGTYSAIRVDTCTVSSSPIMPDPKAITLSVITNGCPVPDNNVFNINNNFRRQGNSTSVWTSGLVRVFKLRTGNIWWLYCRVKICLKGDEDDCAPGPCGGTNTAGRRKRQASTDDDVLVGKEIIVYDENSDISDGAVVINQVDFALLMTVLLILLVLFAVLTVLLYLKLRGKSARVEDNISLATSGKPQRFAMPRMTSSAMRM